MWIVKNLIGDEATWYSEEEYKELKKENDKLKRENEKLQNDLCCLQERTRQ